jgi:hypothetical protein
MRDLRGQLLQALHVKRASLSEKVQSRRFGSTGAVANDEVKAVESVI